MDDWARYTFVPAPTINAHRMPSTKAFSLRVKRNILAERSGFS